MCICMIIYTCTYIHTETFRYTDKLAVMLEVSLFQHMRMDLYICMYIHIYHSFNTCVCIRTFTCTYESVNTSRIRHTRCSRHMATLMTLCYARTHTHAHAHSHSHSPTTVLLCFNCNLYDKCKVLQCVAVCCSVWVTLCHQYDMYELIHI